MPGGLPALPRRLALAQECADPLPAVLGLKHSAEAGLLGLDAGVEIAGRADVLDLLDGERRLLGELARPRQRRVEQLVVDDDAVDQAELERLLGADRIADQVQLERLVGADEARQTLRPSEARDDPQLDLRLAEDRR